MMRARRSHSSAAARQVTTPPQPKSSDQPVSNTRAELYSGVTCSGRSGRDREVREGSREQKAAGGMPGGKTAKEDTGEAENNSFNKMECKIHNNNGVTLQLEHYC